MPGQFATKTRRGIILSPQSIAVLGTPLFVRLSKSGYGPSRQIKRLVEGESQPRAHAYGSWRRQLVRGVEDWAWILPAAVSFSVGEGRSRPGR